MPQEIQRLEDKADPEDREEQEAAQALFEGQCPVGEVEQKRQQQEDAREEVRAAFEDLQGVEGKGEQLREDLARGEAGQQAAGLGEGALAEAVREREVGRQDHEGHQTGTQDARHDESGNEAQTMLAPQLGQVRRHGDHFEQEDHEGNVVVGIQDQSGQDRQRQGGAPLEQAEAGEEKKRRQQDRVRPHGVGHVGDHEGTQREGCAAGDDHGLR